MPFLISCQRVARKSGALAARLLRKECPLYLCREMAMARNSGRGKNRAPPPGGVKQPSCLISEGRHSARRQTATAEVPPVREQKRRGTPKVSLDRERPPPPSSVTL